MKQKPISSRLAATSRKFSPAVRNAREKFDEEAKRIREAYTSAKASEDHARKSKTYVAPWNTAENVLKREAYLLIYNTLEITGGIYAIKSIIREERKVPRSPSFDENPFYWGMLAIAPDEDPYKKSKVSLYAPLLKYAFDHRVPPAYLIGFLFQAGHPADIRRKCKDRQREEEFERVRQKSYLTQ